MRRPLLKGLIALCALVVLCGTPLASARARAVPSGILTVEATGPSGAAYIYDGGGFTCTPASGATFPLGDTTVNCVDAGGITVASFTVRVVDTIPPVVTPPANENVTTGNPSGRAVTYGAASATDAVAGAITPSCSPTSGSNFPVGTTTVTCSASDGTNTGTATSTVTVTLVDTTPPTLSVPGTITTEATGPGGASVAFTVTATDAVDPSPTVSCDHSSGGIFPVGTTQVSCTAKDASNNTSAPAAFNITVRDTTAPTVSVPGPITAAAAGPGGAIVAFTVTASDAVDSSPTVSCNHSSGDTFPVGTTQVSCTAKDASNNTSAPATFNITVRDTTAPTISVPGPITVPAAGPGGAIVTFTVTAADSIDPSPSVSCNHSSGGTFPIGTTQVSCTAKDASNNTSAPATFNITVLDTTAPTVSVPGPITKEATGPGGASVTFTVTATDAVDPSPTISCNHASGATYPLGTTQVSCTAKDASNNTSAPATFNITVQDSTAPTVSVPGPITAPAAGSGAIVTFTVTASDAVDPSPTISCNHLSGATYPIGTTQVSCTAKDASNNTSAPATFNITVQDKTAPTVSVPGPISKEATSASGAAVTFTVTASDAVDPSPTISCNHLSGATYPLGTTQVSCTAKDASNNISAPATFNITVQDKTSPTVSVPGPITKSAAGPSGAVVTFTVTASDAVDPSPTISCNHLSGATYPLGTTQVSCTAKDASNNISAPATFNITVQDKTAPTVSVPGPITKQATSASGAAATFLVTATDTIDPSPSISCNHLSGDTFPIGTTQVSCTAKDASNNTSAPATFNVNVVDTTPPDLRNVPADITAEANGPAGSKVNFLPPTAVDLVNGPIPIVPCVPASNSTFPLGTTTVTCSASDSRGNTGRATFKVKVVDTTPPVLNPPGDTSVYATVDAGIDAAEGGASRFVLGSHAADIADPNPKVTADSPVFFTVGTTTVTFTATDASGNKTSASSKLTVVPKPAQGTTPPTLPPPRDNVPPANITALSVKAGDGRAAFKWKNPSDSDFAYVEITRTTSAPSFKTVGTVVYKGTATSYVDRGLRNDIEYRYVFASFDKNGNSSAGATIVVVPKRALLRTPRDGTRLKKIPKKFVWVADPRASYYNLQLFAGGTLLLKSTTADPNKILSVFPTKAVYTFKSPWKWEGRTYKMTKGLYTWYVWPGYGARSEVKYGPLMGSATFQVTK